MIWYPEEEFCLESTLNKAEQLNALDLLIQQHVSISDFYRKYAITKEFVGKLDSDGFKISRVLRDQRNSFNPVIEGKFLNEKVMEIKFRLHYYTQIFQLIFMGLSFSAVFIGLQESEHYVVYAGIGLVLFAYLIMILPFNTEHKKTKKRLIEALSAKEINKNEY